MKFLADANIPRRLVDRLRSSGHQVFWAYEDAAPGASDEDLIERAAAEDRLILTWDKDFGELVFSHGHRVGVILIRMRNVSLEVMVETVMDLVQSSDDLQHLFVVIESGRVRRTPLPHR
jgi:predicted nuclease of predicted toxin-antitoxin system